MVEKIPQTTPRLTKRSIDVEKHKTNIKLKIKKQNSVGR